MSARQALSVLPPAKLSPKNFCEVGSRSWDRDLRS